MEVQTSIKQKLEPQHLAIALANSTPEEFAKFWLEFYTILEKTDRSELKIQGFAMSMAKSHGGGRKKIFNRLHQLIQFYEVKEEIEQ